jgi:serine/threonine protein kinase
MIGKKLLHYEIIDKLGEGGMGEVYRARDTRISPGIRCEGCASRTKRA